MTLNQQQQEAVDFGVSLYQKREKKFSILGAGGTGKTFTANALIAQLRTEMQISQTKPKVLVLAPTNKALRVIKNSTESQYEYRTLHSALGLQAEFDKHGRLQFDKQSQNNVFKFHSIITVDEISMVPQPIKNLLIEQCDKHGNFLIGLGDQYQHFPVGEKVCSLIEHFRDTHSYTLTQIMRQNSDNPISSVIIDAREAVINGTKNYDPREKFEESNIIKKDDGNQFGYYCYYDAEDAFRQIKNAFTKVLRQELYDLAKVICWRNKTAKQLNTHIRQMLFGNDANTDFIPGDLLICRSPVIEDVIDYKTGDYVKSTTVATSTEGLVINVEPTEVVYRTDHFNFDYKAWNIEFQPLHQDETHTIKIINSMCATEYEQNAEMIRNHCIQVAKDTEKRVNLWRFYYKHQELFNNFTHAYAVTSHLAQGSTYDNCFVHADDISRNNFDFDVRNRSFYVAVSRASLRLIMF